ncbi:MAG TPA: radical SAM family heme chaperone HemW, partial [Candidatus Eisenbacteria bacterium]
ARAGLYVHVPFCATRCTYCDFSSGALSGAAVERYLAAIEREAALRAPSAAGLAFSSVFFGGGTPSALAARHFRRLARALAAHFTVAPGAEITLEANPESVRPALLDAWREAGVNRLSMGAQSFVPAELERLGRLHPAGRPAEAIALARTHGFARLSLDLMFGFPGHTAGSWRVTLERALALEPEHLSAYCFIPEPGTPLGNAVLAGAASLPAPGAQADLHAQLTARLARAGFGCYETSNFCRPGAEARHNLVYWLRRPYLGLGPSAHGLIAGERYGNHYALEPWAAALERGEPPESEHEAGDLDAAASECVMLALRLSTGLRTADYPRPLARAIERRYGAAFAPALAAGRLVATDGALRIDPVHRFVADDIIAWIEARARRAGVDSHASASVPSSPCPSLPSPAA